jgi:hypothetical protein
MEELRAQTQHQLAVHPYGFLGVTAQKIMNRLLQTTPTAKAWLPA